ncbi:copper homeostasis membrane protein CopD [Pseudomonas protegens]|uniref:Copper resistance protein D n=1 Tax=Pseudomonas protegens TaxID=380021 RepID=A0A7G8YQR0_9PSED|nr:copper homeostasis membrane protein CopD [Pseudomonas protegens]QNH78008.1 copper homeostasis membrane protein CopD [Pseudomonas protegens]QNL07204.1 copper homeostasis membrane protein CopD [Pseudomonas protegens]
MATWLVLCRFVHFAVVLALVGAWVFRPLLLGRDAAQNGHGVVRQQLDRLSRWLALIGLCSGLCWLLLISASMAGSWPAALDPATVQLVLGKTFFGQVWSWHLLLNLLLLGLLLTTLGRRLPLQLGLGALLLATLAPVGHGAMLDGLAGQMLILNQVVHLSCVAIWLGGLLVLLLVLRQPPQASVEPLLRRFSGVGYGLVAGLLASGLINVRVLTGQWWPTPLFSGFALILLIKVLLVAGMLGLALFNRLRIRGCDQRLTSLRNSVQLEWLLGVAAVAAVSLLGTLPPMQVI